MKTANIIFPEVEIHCDDRLREIDLGDWEGRLQSDLDEEDPDIHSSFWTAPHRYQKEGAETFAQVAERSVAFFKEIVDGVPRIVRFGCTARHEHSHSGAY